MLTCTLFHGNVPDLSALQRADDRPTLRLSRPAGWYGDGLLDRARSVYGAGENAEAGGVYPETGPAEEAK